MAQLDKESEKWIEEQEKLMAEGEEIIKQASDEAVDYMKDAIDNLNDKAWRKMAMSTQIVEMGIGVGMAEHLFPVIYKDMERTLHKKMGIDKGLSKALRHIYIGRVIKNIRKALDERNQ